MHKWSNGFRASILSVYTLIGIALVYEGFRTHFSDRFFGILLLIASVLMLRILIWFKVVKLPSGFAMGFINRSPKYAQLVKAAACFLAAAVWTVISVRVVSDTLVGVAIIFLPMVLLLIAMGIFVMRSLF